MKNKAAMFKKLPIELIFWLTALISLWFFDPYGNHYSLCPLSNLGIDWCPGCGLGRSMALLMKGHFIASWEMHPLGGFALVVIIFRIFEIIKNLKTTKNYG
jgi:hypothetical protein